jgi:hypothetical protein
VNEDRACVHALVIDSARTHSHSSHNRTRRHGIVGQRSRCAHSLRTPALTAPMRRTWHHATQQRCICTLVTVLCMAHTASTRVAHRLASCSVPRVRIRARVAHVHARSHALSTHARASNSITGHTRNTYSCMHMCLDRARVRVRVPHSDRPAYAYVRTFARARVYASVHRAVGRQHA